MPKIFIDKDRCKGCELCVHAGPQQILKLSKTLNVTGYFPSSVVEPTRCIGCRICAVTCPDVAISVGINGAQYVLFDY